MKRKKTETENKASLEGKPCAEDTYIRETSKAREAYIEYRIYEDRGESDKSDE